MAPGSKGEAVDARKVDGNAEPEKSEEGLEWLFEYIDEKHGFLINRLRDFVEFRTVSSDPSKKDEFPRMAEFMVEILKKFGVQSTVMNMIETEENDERAEGDVVPLILAETEIDPGKRTVLFYCHYDVHPINFHECWTDPFDLTMTHDESELHGKGTSAGKGPLLCIINALGAYQKKKIPLPVNVKIILDPMGTVEGDFTGKFLRRVDTDFFFNVDFVCLCIGRWLGATRPCVSHGARGLCYFTVEVEGPSKDLHSGSYGGLFNEPMADLVYVLNGLVDKNGTIRINDIYEDVPPITKEEKKFFKSIHFSVRDFQQEIGAKELQVNEDKAAILMRLWRQPSLTIHGIQGAFSGPGTKNIIPGKVTGKFSINLVPNMSPSKVKKKVVDYLAKVWKSRKSTNKIRVQMTVGKLFWYTDPSDMNVIAAKNAVAKVYNNQPDLIRQPNRIRIANVLRKLTEAPVVMIPIGKSNDISDADSEKLDVMNYTNGSKIFAVYMKYLAELFPRVKTPEEAWCTCKITGQLESCKCYLQHIPPPEEEEMDNRLSPDRSVSQSSPGMSFDEKPEFKYYYLSLLAMKRMQKLQEVISISHLVPIGSTASSKVHQEEQPPDQVVHSSVVPTGISRIALASFSVSDLHDVSKPRTGGWLAKRASTENTHQLETTTSSFASLRPPESSTNIIPQQAGPHFEPSIVALQPTVFSFSMAQTLKRDRFKPFNPAKHQVLKDIRLALPGPTAKVPGNDVGASKSLGGIPSTEISSKPAGSGGVENPKIHAASISAPDLLSKSQKLQGNPSSITVSSEVGHPNVKRSINPSDVVSSLSRILYKKRLDKGQTESTESLKSQMMSFQTQPSSNKLVRNSNNKEAFVDPSVSSSVQQKPDIGVPGSPVRPYAVVSSLSREMYNKRLAKEAVTDSMKGLKSGLDIVSASSANAPSVRSTVSTAASLIASSAANSPGSPSVRSAASPIENPATDSAASGAASPAASTRLEQPVQLVPETKNRAEQPNIVP